MIIIPMRRKWKRTLDQVREWCVVYHVFGDWYIVRNLLKESKIRSFKHAVWFVMWFLVNEKDFPTA